jgi:phosphoenolpyruvate carboxylase
MDNKKLGKVFSDLLHSLPNSFDFAQKFNYRAVKGVRQLVEKMATSRRPLTALDYPIISSLYAPF